MLEFLLFNAQTAHCVVST